MATHETYTTINSDSAQYVWDPFYNNQQTEFSTQSDFTYTEDYVSLVSGGFSTDFERTNGGFSDATSPPIDDISRLGTWDSWKMDQFSMTIVTQVTSVGVQTCTISIMITQPTTMVRIQRAW